MATYDRQSITSRMIQKAAALWGIAPKDIERSFDPLVALLIEACASELEKIETEIGNSETRITEKLIQLMTPEAIHSAQPAHAIAYAEPVEAMTTVHQKTNFLTKKKITNSSGSIQKSLFFTPSREMRLVNARIKNVVCNQKLYEVDERQDRQQIGTLQGVAEPSTIYFGIQSDQEDIPLHDVSLYFELQQPLKNDLFYHHLGNVSCSLNGEKIQLQQGFFDQEEQQRKDIDAWFETSTNITRRIERTTNQYYRAHFLTIKSLCYLTKESKVPKGLFAEADLKKHGHVKQLNWLAITFPRMIDDRLLNDVHCSLNAFPVLNRKLNSFTYQLKDFIHIIPVQTNDLFLDMDHIENTEGKTYTLRQNSLDPEQKGTYMLREDQSGKLDSRTAKQFLRHMIELLKEESGSFSFLGSDFLQSNINKLNQTILLLEKRAEDLTEQSKETLYLALKPFKQREMLTVSFWSTDGFIANKLKAGKVMQHYEGTEIKQKSGFLLTNTQGGKDSLSMQERLNAYRSTLLSRDRIVTKEDVRALCYAVYNDRISAVTVSKGYTMDIAEQKGVVPCMQITLAKNKKYKLTDSEWQALHKGLLAILKDKSANVFPYVIEMAS